MRTFSSLTALLIAEDAAVTTVAQRCLKLHTLHLLSCRQITDMGVIALVKERPKLRHLDLGFCEKITDAAVIAVAQGCPQLESLFLNGSPNITDATVIALVENCPLQLLDLRKCSKIRNETLAKIIDNYKDLQLLSYNFNPY